MRMFGLQLNSRQSSVPALFFASIYVVALKGKVLYGFVKDQTPDVNILEFLATQLAFIGIILIIAALIESVSSKVIKHTLRVSSLSIFFFFILDFSILARFDQNLDFADLARFYREWRICLTFVNFWDILLIVVLILFHVLQTRSVRTSPPLIALAGIALIGLSHVFLRNIQADLRLSTFSFDLLRIQFSVSEPPQLGRYSAAQAKDALEIFGADAPVQIPSNRPDIFLVLVESMSAAFSSRTSGVFNYLPEFDKRTSKGILFTNFHANYSLTEGGVVSTLSGVAPIPFPGPKRRDLYDSFGLARSIPQSLKNLGYETEFIINTKPNFLQKEAYLRKIGFDRVITERDVPEFKKAERFAFNASSDAVLFNYVLGRIEATKDAQNPRFFGTLTISSHPPYRDPEKIADTRENVWKFVDLQLAHVIDRLEGDGFFERGILIVLADHREPGPVSKVEQARYGPTANKRIVLYIQGLGVPANRLDDRFFSQADLFAMLSDAISQSAKGLSDVSIWVDNHRRSASSIILAFFEQNSVKNRIPVLEVDGITLNWKNQVASKEKKDSLEKRVENQRAAFQLLFEKSRQSVHP